MRSHECLHVREKCMVILSINICRMLCKCGVLLWKFDGTKRIQCGRWCSFRLGFVGLLLRDLWTLNKWWKPKTSFNVSLREHTKSQYLCLEVVFEWAVTWHHCIDCDMCFDTSRFRSDNNIPQWYNNIFLMHVCKCGFGWKRSFMYIIKLLVRFAHFRVHVSDWSNRVASFLYSIEIGSSLFPVIMST